jgi:hypothetical protein
MRIFREGVPNMKSGLVIAALALGLGVALPAAAQQPGPPPGVGGWAPPPPMANPNMPPHTGGPMMGMGPGMGAPYMGGPYTGQGPGMGGGPMMGPGPRHRWADVTPEQREAYMAMRIANIKAALRLTPDQEKLWPAVETAMRESAAAMSERAKKRAEQGRPADPIAALRLGAENMTARAAMMTRMADASAPLYASLNDQQKAQLPRIFRRMGHGGGKHMRMMREGWDGPEMGPGGWGGDHHRRWWNRD